MIPHHQIVGTGQRWALVLHGIYGSGGNWRTFARKLAEQRPDWGFVLVDLRMHGRSQDAETPHTVQAAAGDLAELAAELAGSGRRVRAIIGHSFGGKVTLSYAAERGGLDQAWILDSSPAARPNAIEDEGNSVVSVLHMMEAMPPRFESRDAFVAWVKARGYPPMLANWLAMNLDPEGEEFRFRLDPAAMRALLTDYYQLDMWPPVEAPPCPLRFVLAGQSSAVSDADRDRLVELAEASDQLRVDVLAGAGHWLHIDALDDLLALVSDGLP